MKSLVVGCAFVVAFSAAPIVAAQTYPAKPVTIVVPFSAGGPTDTLARVMSDRLRKALGQAILVDNTLGAGGSIGTGKVAKAPPDGYMVSIGHWGTHVVNGVYYNLPFNVLTDFEPVAMIATNPQVIISKIAVPAKTLADLNAWIVANQNKALMGTGGVGGASHMAAIYYGNRIGVKFQYIPYKGGAPALMDVLGGNVNMMIIQPTSKEQITSGQLRALAISSNKRSSNYPDVPTVAEAGVPGYQSVAWYGLVGPKDMPPDVLKKISDEVAKASQTDAVKKIIEAQGGDLVAGSAKEFKDFIDAERKRYAEIVKASGMQVN